MGLRVAMLAPIAWGVPPRQLVEEAITGFLVRDVKQVAEALTKVGSLDRAQYDSTPSPTSGSIV